jgi:hypothetical protein
MTLVRIRSGSAAALLALCLVTLFLGLTAQAQTSQGSITGRVSDASGAVVKGAAVVVTNLDTGVQSRTTTNSSGIYNVISLNAGNYKVEVSAPGFQQAAVDKIILGAAASVETNIALKIGSDKTLVTVTTQSDLLSNTSDVASTVDHTIVENLPYPERSSLEAALLVPGANGDSLIPAGIQSENPNIATGAVMPGSSIQIGGSVAGTTAIVIDGSDVMQAGVPRAGLNLSGRIVEETTVITSGLSAKYGRTSAGALVQQSKGGTSQYHGGVTWRHTDPWFNAVSAGSTAKNDLHENFYGFYLGGPVFIPKLYPERENTFFFVGVEPARERLSITIRGAFRTPDELAGHFYNSPEILNATTLKNNGYAAALAAPRIGQAVSTAGTNGTPNGSSLFTQTVLTPAGNCGKATGSTGFPCGPNTGVYAPLQGPLSDCASAYTVSPNPGATTCVDDLTQQLSQNAFAQFVMSLMPTPSSPGPYVKFDYPTGAYESDFTNANYNRGVTDTDNRYSFRIDQQFNNSNNLYVRYTVIPIVGARFFAVVPTNPLDQIVTDISHAHDIAIGYTRLLSSSVVNNLHYSLMRDNSQRQGSPATLGTDYAAKYGLTPANEGHGFPILGSFNANGTSYTLQPGTGNSGQVDQNFIGGDDLSWTRGPHLLQFGVDLRWIQSTQYNAGNGTGGTYSFTNGATQGANGGGDALASFDLGVVVSYANTPVPTPGYYRWHYYAGYFQDDWRVMSRLTLNLGLRYEVETPRREKFDNQAFVVSGITGTTPNGSPANAAFCFSGACGLGDTLWPINYWGIEPRVGVSYALSERTTLRAAYTLTRMPLSGYESSPDPNLNVGGSTINSTTGGQVTGDLTDYISNPIVPPGSPFASFNGSRGPFFYSTGLSPVFVSQSNAVPNIQTYGVTFQYQPLQKTLLQAAYQGTKGTHLVGSFVSQNTPSLATVTAAVQQGQYLVGTQNNKLGITNPGTTTPISESNMQLLEPYQSFFNQALNQIYPRDGTLEYDALYLSINQRFNRNVSALASYTWSKSLDDVPDITSGTQFASTNVSGVQDPFMRSVDYSVSATDQPSRFKAGYNALLPFGINQPYRFHNGILDRIIGNISTSGITTWASGLPNFVTFGTAGNFYSITPAGQGAVNGSSGCAALNTAQTNPWCSSNALPSGYALRPNIIPGISPINPAYRRNPYNSLGAGGISSYLNPAAFGCSTPAGSTTEYCAAPGSPNNPALGNAPRWLANARSPRQFTFDMRFVKGFNIHGTNTLNLTGTFQDIFNHQVFNAVSVHTLAASALTCNVAGPPNAANCPNGQVINNTFNSTFGNLIGTNFARVIRVGAEYNF